MTEQLVVPRPYVSKVLFMAHTHLLGAHLGMDKTRDRVLARFYWPGVKRDVELYCQVCPECQRVASKATVRNSLIPMPIIETPFDRIALDIDQPGTPVHLGPGGLCHPVPQSPTPTGCHR